jgi:hypothetical protein
MVHVTEFAQTHARHEDARRAPDRRPVHRQLTQQDCVSVSVVGVSARGVVWCAFSVNHPGHARLCAVRTRPDVRRVEARGVQPLVTAQLQRPGSSERTTHLGPCKRRTRFQ